MKIKRLFVAEDSEHMLWKQIQEAFNLLTQFAPELRWEPKHSQHEVMPEAKKAYNRVISNKEFFWEDYQTLREYMHTVAQRARTNYSNSNTPIAKQVLRNAENMWGVAAELNAVMSDYAMR